MTQKPWNCLYSECETSDSRETAQHLVDFIKVSFSSIITDGETRKIRYDEELNFKRRIFVEIKFVSQSTWTY